MALIPLKPRGAVWAVTAAVAVAVLAAAPASASQAAPATPVTQVTQAKPGPARAAACQAAGLQVSVPAAIAGDPTQGMGTRAWNILFRNTGHTSCDLRGWPGVQVSTAAGKKVATNISHVSFSNLSSVPAADVVLSPGSSAVVTAMSPTAPRGCVSRWTLGVTLPGAAHPVRVAEPGGSFVPCVGGQLQLSPFYAEQTLTSQIKALSHSTAPSAFPATTAAEPAACSSAALAADVTSVQTSASGAIMELRLSASGAPCVLPGGWPTVRLDETGGASQVAKIFPDTAAGQAEKSLLTTYQRGTAQDTALTLHPGTSVSFAVFAAKTSAQACRQVTAVTIFPTATAAGAGRATSLSTPVRICGAPRVLSFLPARSGDLVTSLARSALAAAVNGAAQATGTGFYQGTDSAAPTACGTGPFTEPKGSCSNGTSGSYGEYIGEIGAFWHWQGCTTSGLAWDQSNYNMATDNFVDYHTGLGAAVYWFAGGPGRDPQYNGSVAEATQWGRVQAEQAILDLGGKVLNFRYIFMDIENNGAPPDENGWNSVWNGPCGSTVKADYIPAKLDVATWEGFARYVDQKSPYQAGVYSAGGDYYGSWTGIFGGQKLSNTALWTYTNEQGQLTFPAGFSGQHAGAQWFGGEPASCQLLWQWSGGDGVLNGYGDFDVANAANNANPSCSTPAPGPTPTPTPTPPTPTPTPTTSPSPTPTPTASPTPNPTPTRTHRD
jgi:cell division septation protein DedD